MQQYPVRQNDGNAPREFGMISQEALETLTDWVRSGACIPEGCTSIDLLDWRENQNVNTSISFIECSKIA